MVALSPYSLTATKYVPGARRRMPERVVASRAEQSPTPLSSSLASSVVPLGAKKLATVSAPDARLLIIKPYDASTLSAIERGILNGGLGLNPSSDGVIVRVPIPPLTGERRKSLVKQIKDHGEDAKIVVRNGRRDANDLLKEAEKDKEISEDDLKKGLDRIQVLTDEYVKLIDQTIAKKEAEIMNE